MPNHTQPAEETSDPNGRRTKGTLRSGPKKVNDIIAPAGWTRDINLDLPLWRYACLAIAVAGGFLALVWLSPTADVGDGDWVFAAVLAGSCVVPPILRRVYLAGARLTTAAEASVSQLSMQTTAAQED